MQAYSRVSIKYIDWRLLLGAVECVRPYEVFIVAFLDQGEGTGMRPEPKQTGSYLSALSYKHDKEYEVGMLERNILTRRHNPKPLGSFIRVFQLKASSIERIISSLMRCL